MNHQINKKGGDSESASVRKETSSESAAVLEDGTDAWFMFDTNTNPRDGDSYTDTEIAPDEGTHTLTWYLEEFAVYISTGSGGFEHGTFTQ